MAKDGCSCGQSFVIFKYSRIELFLLLFALNIHAVNLVLCDMPKVHAEVHVESVLRCIIGLEVTVIKWGNVALKGKEPIFK